MIVARFMIDLDGGIPLALKEGGVFQHFAATVIHLVCFDGESVRHYWHDEATDESGYRYCGVADLPINDAFPRWRYW